MVAIVTFSEALKRSEGKPRTLLLGNGFSIRYFYKNLLERAGLQADDSIRALFARLNTFDFERVVKALEDAATVELAYKQDDRSKLFVDDAARLREALVRAVRETHPGHREDIEGMIPYCVEFLSSFGDIFTLNYDLLLYWVILGSAGFNDGFGLGLEENGFRGPFKTHAHCNVFNVHGGLHLFETDTGEVEKRLMGASGVIDAIAKTITKAKRMPLYVAEGTAAAKLRRINASPYLRHCYEKFLQREGFVFVYGHSGDTNDAHIYEGLFGSGIEHLFFCVHRPTAKVEDLDGELARYKRRTQSKIDYTFVDSETVPVWEKP
jgi:hypothetical protein